MASIIPSVHVEASKPKASPKKETNFSSVSEAWEETLPNRVDALERQADDQGGNSRGLQPLNSIGMTVANVVNTYGSGAHANESKVLKPSLDRGLSTMAQASLDHQNPSRRSMGKSILGVMKNDRGSVFSYIKHNIVVAAQAGSNMWASCFNIRVEVDEREQRLLLGNRRFLNGDVQDCHAHWLRKLLESRRIAQILKCFALLTMVFAPMQFSLEPTCEFGGERQAVAVLKVIHLSCSWLYCLLSAGQFAALTTNLYLRARGSAGVYCRVFVDILAQSALIAEMVHLSERPHRLPTGAQGFMLMGTLKAWRVFFPNRHLSKVLQTFTIQVVQLFFWLVLAAHTSACFFLAIAMYETEDGRKTWMDSLLTRSQERSCTDFYAAAVYFCTYTLTSIGYGDFVPANALEHVACVIFMLASQMFAAKIFADLTWITTTHQHWKAQYHARLTQTAAALDSMGVHPSLRHRVLAYQDFIEEEQTERRAQELLHDLSQPLREELKLVVYYDLVVKAPFLQEQPTWVVRVIISSLADVVFLPCDVIIRKGDLGTELFFLRNGRAAVYKTDYMPDWTGDKEVFVLKNGAYFGEVALLTGQPRTSWVIARTYCICSILPKQVIDDLMAKHPHCIASLVSSLKNTLGLKPTINWGECAKRMRKEFKTEQDLFNFTCSGDDGEAPAGHVTWQRFESLMQRLQISTLDRKLLWVDLDEEYTGTVLFQDFLAVVARFKQPSSKENGETKNEPSSPKHPDDGAGPEPADIPDQEAEEGDTSDFGEEADETRNCDTQSASAGTGEERHDEKRRGSNRSGKSSFSNKSNQSSTRQKSRGSRTEARLYTCTRLENPTSSLHSEPQAMMTALMERLDSMSQQVSALTSHLGCRAQEGWEQQIAPASA